MPDGTRTPACRKLIGARFFSKGIQLVSSLPGGEQPSSEDASSPRDYEGHGTHTLSTAGGAFVPDASVLGRGKGRAAGGSPLARVAAYKACFAAGCSGVDVLAAIVAAVEDGVDVLSMSLGSPASDYLTDPIAIGTLYAVQRGSPSSPPAALGAGAEHVEQRGAVDVYGRRKHPGQELPGLCQLRR